MTNHPSPSLANYQLRLETFEGPLDVLLQLIERQRLDISNLSLIAVTDGFLAHIDGLDNPAPRLLAEFAAIAARLLVLKTRSLLPSPSPVEADEPLDDLAARLIEYQRVKRLAALMRENEESGWRSYQSPVPPPGRQVNVRLILPTISQLHRSFVQALARQPSPPEIAPIRPAISVADMARRIMSFALRPGQRFLFADIVPNQERHATIAAFVALLSLWARRELVVQQPAAFGSIEIRNASTDRPVDVNQI